MTRRIRLDSLAEEGLGQIRASDHQRRHREQLARAIPQAFVPGGSRIGCT